MFLFGICPVIKPVGLFLSNWAAPHGHWPAACGAVLGCVRRSLACGPQFTGACRGPCTRRPKGPCTRTLGNPACQGARTLSPSRAPLDPHRFAALWRDCVGRREQRSDRDGGSDCQGSIRRIASCLPWAKAARAVGMRATRSIRFVPMAARDSASGVTGYEAFSWNGSCSENWCEMDLFA